MSKVYSPGNNVAVIAKKSVIKFSVAAILLICNYNTVNAQVLWNDGGAATDWYTAGNWNPNKLANSWLTTDIAQFNNAGTATTAGIDMSQGSLSIGALVLDRNRDLTIGNSSATAGSLTLNGATVEGIANVIISSIGPLMLVPNYFIQNNETGTGKAMDLVLGNTTNNIISLHGGNRLEISAAITGAGKNLTVSSSNFSSDGGMLVLSGANTYTGLTTISVHHGSVNLERPGGNTLPAGNNLVIGEGYLNINSDQTFHDLTLSSTFGFMSIADGVTVTITGTLHKGDGHINMAGTGKLVYAPGATLSYEFGSTAGSTGTEFPDVSGPTNVTIPPTYLVQLNKTHTITGTLNLGSFFVLGNSDFTTSAVNITGTYGGAVINGTGRLIISNVGAAPVSFPVAVTQGAALNTVTISNGQGLNYAVGVKSGITPSIVNSNNAVNRTWYIKPSATPAAPVNVSFKYSSGDANAGFNYGAPVELGQYTTAWNVVQSGIVQAQPVATTISTLAGNVDNFFIISNTGAVLASESTIDFNAVKQNDKGYLTWAIENTTTLKQLEIERSANGRNFISLATVAATSIYFDDNQLLPATNYYRLKMTDVNGKISYSIIIALINNKTGFDMVSVLPTIVSSNAILNVSSAQKTKIDVVITDISGRKVQQMKYTINAGSSQVALNLVKLSTGVYVITAYTSEGDVKTLRFVKN
jgi:hypothetical protein